MKRSTHAYFGVFVIPIPVGRALAAALIEVRLPGEREGHVTSQRFMLDWQLAIYNKLVRKGHIMTNIRTDVAKAISENELNDVVFQDPFTEETRKAKRNLVAASFAGILISALDLQVNGFLGLQTATGVILGAAITKGIACLVIMYFLAGFALSAYIDYSAWKFKRERVLVRPYLDLIKMLEAHIRVTGEQVSNATARLNGVVIESDMRSQVEFTQTITEAKGQLSSIQSHARSLHEEFKPLLAHWSNTVSKADRLFWRLRSRFFSLWSLDIAIPLLLAVGAISRTHDGLFAVWGKIAV